MKNNKISHLFTVACKGSSIDFESQLISIHEMIDEFTVDVKIDKDIEKINLPIQFQIVSIWEKEISDKDTTIDTLLEFIDPDGIKLGEFKYQFIFPANKKRFRNRLNINGVALTKSGTYIYKLKKREAESQSYSHIFDCKIDFKINKQINNVKIN